MSSLESVVLPNGDVWRPRYGKGKANVQEAKTERSDAKEMGGGTDCPWCGMACKTKPALASHVKSKHKSVLEDRDTLQQQAALAAALTK